MTLPKSHVWAIAAAILILAAAPAALAETSLFGSVGFPTGDFAKVTTAGWSFGGYATKSVLPSVAVGGYVAYTDFVVDTTAPGAGLRYGPSLNAWEIEALGQVDIRSLKGILGLGVANYSGIDDAGNSQRKSGFAWQLGVAARFTFLEGQLVYHQIKADGGTANWIGLSAGMLF